MSLNNIRQKLPSGQRRTLKYLSSQISSFVRESCKSSFLGPGLSGSDNRLQMKQENSGKDSCNDLFFFLGGGHMSCQWLILAVDLAQQQIQNLLWMAVYASSTPWLFEEAMQQLKLPLHSNSLTFIVLWARFSDFKNRYRYRSFFALVSRFLHYLSSP